jgi:hypothetical protein
LGGGERSSGIEEAGGRCSFRRSAVVETEVAIAPEKNSQLMGLYARAASLHAVRG